MDKGQFGRVRTTSEFRLWHITSLLAEAVRLSLANVLPLLLLMLIPFAIDTAASQIMDLATAAAEHPEAGIVISALALVSGPLVVVASLLVVVFAEGAWLAAVSDARRTGSVSLGNAVKMGWNLLPRLLPVIVAVTLIVTIGLAFFILPGLYLLARLFLAPAATVNEGLGFPAALERSWTLTRDHVDRLLAYVVATLLASLLAFLLLLLLGILVLRVTGTAVPEVEPGDAALSAEAAAALLIASLIGPAVLVLLSGYFLIMLVALFFVMLVASVIPVLVYFDLARESPARPL